MMIKIGDHACLSKKLTEIDVLRFAELSGDCNPVHVDPQAAKKSRFGKQVCHGMLVSSLISAILGTKLPGQGTIYLEQTLEFVAPVYIGDTVTAEVVVIEINKKIITLKTDIVNEEGKTVVCGTAKVLYEGVGNNEACEKN